MKTPLPWVFRDSTSYDATYAPHCSLLQLSIEEQKYSLLQGLGGKLYYALDIVKNFLILLVSTSKIYVDMSFSDGAEARRKLLCCSRECVSTLSVVLRFAHQLVRFHDSFRGIRLLQTRRAFLVHSGRAIRSCADGWSS